MKDMIFRSYKAGHCYACVIIVFLMMSVFGCGKTKEAMPDTDINNKDSVSMPDTLKVVSFNIEYGMRSDRANNYDNFVRWVDSVAPDILMLQEVNGFRQHSLERLADRWGHKYVITNVKATDNFPVAITSKYPIESGRRMTMHVSHGAIFATLKGTDLNIIVTHLWPQSYWHVEGDNLGNDYRLHEINIILDSTVRKYPDESKWIFAGDFNSLDKKDYGPEDNTGNLNFDVTNEIETSGFEDYLHYTHGYKLNGSRDYDYDGYKEEGSLKDKFNYYPGHRIDFMFATKPVLQEITEAYTIHDGFTSSYSDHYHANYMKIEIKDFKNE